MSYRFIKKLGKLCVGLIVALVAVVFLVGAAAALALYTETGAAIVVHRALRWYNETIPGNIELERVSGNLGSTFGLHNVVAVDGTGGRLAAIGLLVVDWTPRELLSGSLSLGNIQVHKASLDIYPERKDNPFADLAPRKAGGEDLESESEQGTDLVSLPLSVEASFQLSQFSLLEHRGSDDRHLVKDGYARLRSRAARNWIELDILQLRGMSPDLNAELQSLGFKAELKGKDLWIRDLQLKSNYGELSTRSAKIDLEKLHGETEIDARIPKSVAQQLAQTKLPTDLVVTLDFKGSPESFQSQLSLVAEDNSRLKMIVDGAVRDKIDLKASVQVENFDPQSYGEMQPGKIAGSGELTVRGPDFRLAEIEGTFRCEKCRFWPVDILDADIGFQLKSGSGSGKARLRGAGLFVNARTVLSDWRPEQLFFKVKGQNLAHTRRVLAKAIQLPPMSGSLSASGRCSGKDEKIRCRGSVQGSDLQTAYAQVSSAKLAYTILPFQANIEFTGKLQARGVTVEGKTIREINCRANGDLTRVRLALTSHISGDTHLTTDLTWRQRKRHELQVRGFNASYENFSLILERPARLRFDESSIYVDELALKAEDGSLYLAGMISQKSQSNLHVEAHNFSLRSLSKIVPKLDVDGVVNVEGDFTGRKSAPEVMLAVTGRGLKYRNVAIGELELQSHLRRNILSGSFAVRGEAVEELEGTLSMDVPFDFSSMTPKQIQNQNIAVTLNGREIALQKVASWIPQSDISGTANLNIALNGTFQNPVLHSTLQINGLNWENIGQDHIEAQLAWQNSRAHFTVQAKGDSVRQLHCQGMVPVRLDMTRGAEWLADEKHQVKVDLTGIDLALLKKQIMGYVPGASLEKIDVKGLANVQASFDGLPALPGAEMRAVFTDLQLDRRPLGNARIRLEIKKTRADVHAEIEQGKSSLAVLRASIPISANLKEQKFEWLSQNNHSFALQAAGIDRALLERLFDFPLGTDFRLEGNISGAGTSDEFALTGKWRGILSQPGFVSLPIWGNLKASQDAQKISLEIGSQAKPFLKATVSTHISPRMIGANSFSKERIPFRGLVEVPGLDIAPFSSFLPTSLHKARGVLKGEISAQGTIGKPSIDGNLFFSDGEITIVDLNQRIKNIGFSAHLTDQNLQVRDFKFTSGRGAGTGNFRAQFSREGTLQGALRLRLKKFPLVRPGIPEGRIDVEVETDVEHGPETTDVHVALHDTVIRLLERTGSPVPKAIPGGENIVFVEDLRAGRAEILSPKDDHPETRTTRILLDMTDPVEILGPGIDMRWAGKVAVSSQQSGDRITGGIRAFPGRFRFLQNTFEIESGEVTLPTRGILDPYVSLVANTSAAEADVTITVRGRLSRPDLELSSTPAMSQYEILSLLITGKADTAGTTDESIQAQAASLLLWFQNPALERQFYSRLGLDRVYVSLGDSVEEPVFAVGKRVGRKLYVETQYHHGASANENRVGARVEYRINPNWSLETSYGDAQKGEVGIFWRKQFNAKSSGGSNKRASSTK